MTHANARRTVSHLICGALCLVALRPAAAQSAAVPVVAVGEGRSFSAALTTALRMAVESGAGATVQAAAASRGDRLTTDSVRSVSRGVVTRYALVDSSTVPGGTHVRILAMVSRIAERDAVSARGRRIAAPGDLWRADATLDSERRFDEGRLLGELFSSVDSQANAFDYSIEAGPPIHTGANFRLRLRIIRSPSAAYTVLRDRARELLAAVAGPAGSRTTHMPATEREQVTVSACVSHCAADERRVLNPRAALDDTDSLGAFDPPVVTTARSARVQTLFPSLSTAGGFAVAFPDSAAKKQQFVHVRSTRAFLAVANYLRATFDDARFRLELGDRSVDLIETFRAARTGQPEPRFTATAPRLAPPVALVQGFRPHTSGGPGAPTMLGSPYVIITVPVGDQSPPDTALVDVSLTPEQVAKISEIGVAPVTTAQRALPFVASSRGQAAVPTAVLDAIARAPLADGDGAVAIGSAPGGSVVAVGTGVIDAAAPTQACSVARLRAQRELTRFLTGSHVEGKTGLATSESRGGQVQEQFHEEINETVAGRLGGASLAAQWTVSAPARCRVALWLPAK